MRRLALLCSAVLAVLLVAGCGGSSSPAHKHKKKHTTEHHAVVVSAATIASSASKAAAEPGYAVDLSLSIDSSALDGTASATGSGVFDAQGGNLHLALKLPGIFALLNPLRTTAILSAGNAYLKVPSNIAAQLPKVKPWLVVDLAGGARALGLSANALTGTLTPHAILEALATHSSGDISPLGSTFINGTGVKEYKEQVPLLGSDAKVDVWIDPSTGLLSQVAFSFSSQGGVNQASARITFDGYGKQTLEPVPPVSQTGGLSAAIRSLSA